MVLKMQYLFSVSSFFLHLINTFLSRVLLYIVYTVYTEEAKGGWIPYNYGKLALLVVLNAHLWPLVMLGKARSTSGLMIFRQAWIKLSCWPQPTAVPLAPRKLAASPGLATV